MKFFCNFSDSIDTIKLLLFEVSFLGIGFSKIIFARRRIHNSFPASYCRVEEVVCMIPGSICACY
jgi:hypothetical protein